MRKSFTFIVVIVLSYFFSLSPAQAAPSKIQFEGFLFPDAVLIDSNRTMTMCLVNQGEPNVLESVDNDHLVLSIPSGPTGSDLEENSTSLGCSSSTLDWNCSVVVQQTQVDVILEPFGATVTVNAAETICFDITGLEVNSATGLSFSNLEQFISGARAQNLIGSLLAVFKTDGGTVQHDDLAAVVSDQHHAKTNSFTEMTDVVTDAQVPDDITINFAADAGTVDGLEGADLEESDEIDADILVHKGITDAHHTKTTSFGELTDTITEAQIPAEIARDSEVTSEITTHKTDSSAHHSAFTDSSNTAVGQNALTSNTGNSNTATGASALTSNTTGFSNTATGVSALASNTTGVQNTAVGRRALEGNTTATNNTAVGAMALFANTTGGTNTATGVFALTQNTTGNSNTATGSFALQSNTTGFSNTGTGVGALGSNTAGRQNTAAGVNAIKSNTTGFSNTGTGFGALESNTTANNNTAVGNLALLRNTTGGNNTAIGSRAGSNLTTGNNNIHINNEGVAGESGTIKIGTQGTQASAFIAGISGTNVVGSPVIVDGSGQLGTGAISEANLGFDPATQPSLPI